LFTQGFFPEALAILDREPALHAERASVGLLDLAALRRLGGLEGIAAGAPEAVRAWIEVASDPAADGAARAEAARAGPLGATARAGGLRARMAAGRFEQAEAVWTGVADAARAAGALERLRFAVALRALVRVRLGRVAEVEADMRELIAWVAELGVPVANQRA